MVNMKIDRRNFIKNAAVAVAGAAVVSPVSAVSQMAEADKTLKVLLVNGSSRPDGNTFCCLQEIETQMA